MISLAVIDGRALSPDTSALSSIIFRQAGGFAMWRQWAFLTVLMALAPQSGFAFDLLTTHEPVRPAQAPGGLLYCLAKGHTVFRVESPSNPRQPAVELAVSPAPVETIKRREIVLIDGAIPANGESAPDYGRRLYVVSVGWVEHLIYIKGAPI